MSGFPAGDAGAEANLRSLTAQEESGMASHTPESTLSLSYVVEALLRRKFWIIVPAILLGAGFTWYARQLPDQFRAQAVIAAANLTSPTYLREVAPAPINIQDHLWTFREVISSAPVLEAAARQLPAYKDVSGPLPKDVLDDVKQGISIKINDEHSFSLSYQGGNAVQVANVTKVLSEKFVDLASAKDEQRTEDTQAILKQQIDGVLASLKEQDAQVRTYKSGAAHELPEHVDDNIRAVEELRGKVLEIDGKIADDESRKVTDEKELHDLEAQVAAEKAPEPPAEKTADEKNLDDLRLKLREYQSRYKPGMPELKSMQKQVEEVEKIVAAQPKRVHVKEITPTQLRVTQLKAELDGIKERVASYRRQQEALAVQMETYNRRVESAPTHERKLDELTREMVVGESQLKELLNKRMDTNLSAGLQKSGNGIAFTVIEPATVPSEPFSPKRARIILMGVFAGLGLGLAAAFLLEQNDKTFGNVDEFQAFTSMPLVAVIPNIDGQPKAGRKTGRKAIVTLSDPDSVAAEQYRILAMKIHQMAMQQHARVLMVTSAAGGEGKSTTAVNLGLALSALVDGPVLLVDADMRRPRLHEYLEIPLSAGHGFHDMLLHPEERTGNYVRMLEGVHVIPGNEPTSNPVAALASPKVRTLFDRLKREYSFIVVDAPPTMPIADSHILSGLCDKVLFVVRARRTPRDLFQHAVESFDAANLAGAVLNDVEYQRSSYGYAYRYYRENYLVRK